MKKMQLTKNFTIAIVLMIILAGIGVIVLYQQISSETLDITEDIFILPEGVEALRISYNFSDPVLVEYEGIARQGLTVVNVKETDFHSTGDGRPVIPVNLTTFTFPFGTKIFSVNYSYSTPNVINLSSKLSYGSCSKNTEDDPNIYQSPNMYPHDFVVYHTGGGLSDNEQKTILNIRVYPVTYLPSDKQILFTDHVELMVLYEEPETPLLSDISIFDLLIIAPNKFSRNLQPLIQHKEKNNIKTKLTTTEEIYRSFPGRDEAEQIKYSIKDAIESYGVTDVLLVGGRDSQTSRWNLPVRYSHVIIREGTQEHIEPEFLSDLYFADIYDSEGKFSCWDTNDNGIFAEYDGGVIDEMDLYPNVRLGRLPCRNRFQVRTVVNKIINYETRGGGDWFKNIMLVAGDHWPDKNQETEGVLIMEAASEIMSGFNPVKLFVDEKGDLTVRDINKAFNQGAGFAYFSGHGSVSGWGAPLPPDSKGWAPTLMKWMPNSWVMTSLYRNRHMNYLRNGYKLPVTVIGGCFNGQFDTTIFTDGALYCWAWKLTSKRGGGAIATIANTALGTHAKDDADNNGINDYLEVYDGWLELRFFELYQEENIRGVGELHQQAIAQYLNRFLGNHDEMDIKMVQQWQLFGDPSLTLN
ncbi:MAG: C25 family cysteine peptidase [Thermoplasmatota archaeon]